MKLRTVCSVGYQPDVGYYRIPGIVRTAAGTLLVVCEARASVSDWAGIDLTLLRSEDGGESWSEPMSLWDEGPGPDLGYPYSVELEDGSIYTVYYGQLEDGARCSILATRWELD